ncbi:MAG: amino acid transport protein [Candidatus Wallbacteria bacterium]
MQELYWFFVVFTGIVGMGYFYSGKRTENLAFIICGILLMTYSLFIYDTFTVVAVGITLTILPFITTIYFK